MYNYVIPGLDESFCSPLGICIGCMGGYMVYVIVVSASLRFSKNGKLNSFDLVEH